MVSLDGDAPRAEVIVTGWITYQLLAGQTAGLPKAVVSNTLTEPLPSTLGDAGRELDAVP